MPPLGEVVAVDSSVFESFSNPNRKTKAGGVSDPDARLGLKHSAKAKDGDQQWASGYKLHFVADASHNLPLTSSSPRRTRPTPRCSARCYRKLNRPVVPVKVPAG